MSWVLRRSRTRPLRMIYVTLRGRAMAWARHLARLGPRRSPKSRTTVHSPRSRPPHGAAEGIGEALFPARTIEPRETCFGWKGFHGFNARKLMAMPRPAAPLAPR